MKKYKFLDKKFENSTSFMHIKKEKKKKKRSFGERLSKIGCELLFKNGHWVTAKKGL